ncbi:MAG: hypothetical protein AAB368_09485, partial [bacterium]
MQYKDTTAAGGVTYRNYNVASGGGGSAGQSITWLPQFDKNGILVTSGGTLTYSDYNSSYNLVTDNISRFSMGAPYKGIPIGVVPGRTYTIGIGKTTTHTITTGIGIGSTIYYFSGDTYIQDSVTGNFLLTKGMEFTRKEAVSLLISAGIEDTSKLAKTKSVNGKQVFSALLPEDFSFIGNSKTCKRCEKCKKEKCDIDAYVSIKNGDLISGIIDRATIGKEAGDLLRNLYS